MKQKIFCLLAVVMSSCISLFSSAKQKRSNCDFRHQISKPDSAKQLPSKKADDSEYDLHPLSFLMFSK